MFLVYFFTSFHILHLYIHTSRYMTVNGMMIVTITVLIIITLIVAKSVVRTKASQVNNVDKSMFLDNIVVGLNCYNLLN